MSWVLDMFHRPCIEGTVRGIWSRAPRPLPPPPRPVPLAPCKVQSELLPRLAQIMFLFNAAINERDALVAVRDEAHPNSQSTKDFNRKVSKGHNGFMGLGL